MINTFKRFTLSIVFLLFSYNSMLLAVDAAGILFFKTEGNQLKLLLAQFKRGDRWGDVGGNRDRGETYYQAAAREAAEESGFILDDVDNLKKLDIDQNRVSNNQVYQTNSYQRFYESIQRQNPIIKTRSQYRQYIVEWDPSWGDIPPDRFKNNQTVLQKGAFKETQDIQWKSVYDFGTEKFIHDPKEMRGTLKGTLGIPDVRSALNIRQLRSDSAPKGSSSSVPKRPSSPSSKAPLFLQTTRPYAIGAALVATVGAYIGRKLYQKKKRLLMKKYNIRVLTPLQQATWRATALASIGVPWYLEYLTKNYNGPLERFIGANPDAISHLYFGHKSTQSEQNQFIKRFFKGI